LDPETILGPVREQLAVEPFDDADALAVAALYAKTADKGLSLGDRACLALAQRLGSSAVTAEHTVGRARPRHRGQGHQATRLLIGRYRPPRAVNRARATDLGRSPRSRAQAELGCCCSFEPRTPAACRSSSP